MEKTRSLNDAREDYLKTWDWWNGHSFRSGIAPGPHKGGKGAAYSIACVPPDAMVNMLLHIGL